MPPVNNPAQAEKVVPSNLGLDEAEGTSSPSSAAPATPFGELMRSRLSSAPKEEAPKEEAAPAGETFTKEQVAEMVKAQVAEHIKATAVATSPAEEKPKEPAQQEAFPTIDVNHFENTYEDAEIHKLAKVADFALKRLEAQEKIIQELQEGQGQVKTKVASAEQTQAEEKTARAMVEAYQDLCAEVGMEIPWDQFTSYIVPQVDIIRAKYGFTNTTPFTKDSLIWAVKTAVANETSVVHNTKSEQKRSAPKFQNGSAGRSNGPGDTLTGIKDILSQED